MNLLLLLSALLSALTGVGVTARQPQAVQAMAQAGGRIADRIADRVAPIRPVPAPATLAALSTAPVARAFAPVAAQPLYASRRRE